MRLTGYIMTALHGATSLAAALLSCDATGRVVNQPLMNVAVLMACSTMIAALATLLTAKES